MTASSPENGTDPRRVAAVLANPEMRAAWAQIVLGYRPDDVAVGLNPARRARVLAALKASGLIERADDETWAATDAPFRSILAQQPRAIIATGVDRFLRNGRIDRYPANLAEREGLLAWIVERAVQPDEILDEKQLNERLAAYSDDYAVLRRYLVDFGMLDRTLSGSSYARAR